MIPRSSIAGMACLAFLSSFEQLLCFAAAAPAPRMEVDRPKFYFPKHVKRIVTNGTQTKTSSTDTETKESTVVAESSTRTPTNTLTQISSQSLTLSLESLLSSLIPAATLEGVPFTHTTPVKSASPGSTDVSGRSAYSSNLDVVSLSITPLGAAASVTTPFSTQPLSSVVASSNNPSQTASTLSKLSGPIDLPDIVITNGTKPDESTFPSVPPTTKPTLETGVTEFGASVTAPPTTVPVNSGTLSSGQYKSGDLAISRSAAAGQRNSESIELSSNSTASLRAELTGDITDGQSELIKLSGSAFADSATRFTTESTIARSQTRTLDTSLTQTTPLGNSSAASVKEEDIIADKAGILKGASEIDFALFGANTIVFSTSKSALATSGISSQVSLTESATQGRNTVATNSSGADIITSNDNPRKTNTPEPLGFVPSSFRVSNSIGVRTTTSLSSAIPEETNTIKPSSVEPGLFLSPSSGVNVSSVATSPGKTNAAQRPDFELSDLDDLASLRPTASTGVPASRKTESAQGSSTDLSEPGPILIGASASVGTGIVGETLIVKESSKGVSESEGSFAPGVTAPITASVPATTNTGREGNIVQSEDGTSGPIEISASLPVKTPERTNAPTASGTVTAKATITASGGGVFPIPVIIPGQSETASLLSSILPKLDPSGSNLPDSDSSTRAVVPEKSSTVGPSGSVAAESNILPSSISKISVLIPLTVPGASDAPQPTLSRTTQPVTGATEPSSVSREAIPQESNKPGTELPDGTTGGLSKSLALPTSSQTDDSLPQISELPRLGPSISEIPGTTGLVLSKTSNIEAPEATEPSASQSGGSPLVGSDSVTASGKETATEAPEEPSATTLPEIKTLSTDAPSEQTGSIPGKPVSTADRDGSPILSSSVIDIPVSIKPSSAAQTDAFTEKPSLTSEGSPVVIPSITGLSSPISIPALTDLPPLVEPSRASETGSSAEKTPQASDGSPISVTGATDLLPSIGPSRTTQTDAAPAKATQPEPSRAALTGTATEGASITDLLPVIEPSRSAGTDPVSEKPASTSDLRGGLPVVTPSVTDSQPPIEPSLATQQYSASISETVGEGRPSNALPIPIPAISSAASVTEDAPPAVISPTLSRPPVLPSLSVPASITNDPDAFTTVPPAVITGLATSGDIPVEPSKLISASDDQATSDRLIGTPTAGSETGLPAIVPQTSRTADQVPIISNPLTNSDLKATLTSDTPIVPITINPPVSSTAEVASPSRSDIFESVPVTVSPAVPLTTEEATKSSTNLPPGILPQPSETSIVSPPIPIDQSTFTAPATSTEAEVPASTGGVPPIIILPSSGPGSPTTESAASAPTGSQLLATATPGDAPVTASGSSAPILVGISDILTASSSNPAVSGYSSPSQAGNTPAAQSTGIIVEPSGLSPSAGAIPTGTPAGSASATNVESVPPNPGVTTGYSSAPLKAEGSGVSGSQAASVTSAIETSKGYLSSGAGLVASPVETSKPLSGLEATASLGGANPAQATTRSPGTSGVPTTVGTQIDLAQSTGAAEVASDAASQTDATGARPSSAVVSDLPSSVPNDVGSVQPGSTAVVSGLPSSVPNDIGSVQPGSTAVASGLPSSVPNDVGSVQPGSTAVASGLPSSVPNDVGSVKPGSTANPLPPSAAASAPSTITPPVKESPNSQTGPFVAVSTGTNTLTAQLIGTSIIAEPSASMPTASKDFPTGIPSSIPRIISPPEGVPPAPDNTTLCQIGFLYPLHYEFVLANPESQRQIFKYLPQGIADGLTIPLANVTMQTLRAYDTTADLHYITTLALFFIPSQQMDLLQLDLHTPAHHIYNNTDDSVKTMMSMINPAIPLTGDYLLGTPAAPGGGNDDSSTSSNPDPANEGVPIGGVDNSSPVRGKSVGIAAGVLCGAAAYGAAMFFVARRYRKRKQSHGRSPSMMNSPVLSGASHDYMGGANTALMSGGRGDGDRSLTPHNGYYYERHSRGSGHSGSTGRHQISAPTNAENSLGWN